VKKKGKGFGRGEKETNNSYMVGGEEDINKRPGEKGGFSPSRDSERKTGSLLISLNKKKRRGENI